VTAADVLQFGLIPELIGRLPLITPLKPLDQEQMVRILTEPRNAIIKQYQHLFQIEGATLEFTHDALEALAEKAMDRGTGARALRAVIDEFMLDIMYDLPDSSPAGTTFIVDGEAVQEGVGIETLARRVAEKESA
jgi:ATP-dependent Clp protease ATP-binding subunit ClpX